MSNDETQAMEHVASWGRQTIAFAMSLRAQEVGRPIDARERVMLAGAEANATAQDLWKAAFDECKKPAQSPEMTMRFAKRVFDWVAEHRAT